ncbi:MAG: hypothetical protein LBS65_01105 [Desulfovibrio sp.]|jgi:hypothetical protein|nr:hypothetical protein [Desulfovibrio sp.]
MNKKKWAGAAPLIIFALFFGYKDVTKRMEEKATQRFQQEMRRDLDSYNSYMQKKKINTELKQDIFKAFSDKKDEVAYNKILFTMVNDTYAYKLSVKSILDDGHSETAVRAASLYCSNLKTFNKEDAGDIQSVAKCFEDFGFSTSTENDALTIKAKARSSGVSPPVPLQPGSDR